MKDLYPFTPRFFTREGVKLHYLDEGEGPPVVLVHGNPTWSFFFRDLVADLRVDHRVVAPDHLGCGRSDRPGPDRYPYTLAARILDLEALLDHLGLDRGVTLVVHDWGGAIGFGAAVRRPERVEKLVVLNTAAFCRPVGKRLPWSLRLCRMPLVGAVVVRGLNAFVKGAVRTCTVRRLPAVVREAYLSPHDSWSRRRSVHAFVRDIPVGPGHPSWETLLTVQNGLAQFSNRPMLICWGERDFVFDGDYLTEWTRRFPDALVHRFAHAGHWVLEDASQEIVPLIRGFVTGGAVTPTSAARVAGQDAAPPDETNDPASPPDSPPAASPEREP